MTIAMCYLLGEGVVLGADSTTSTTQGGFHYFNNNQKLFEIGENSTLGIVTWGLGSLEAKSHRTLIADFADDLVTCPAADMQEVATRWRDAFYAAYTNDGLFTIYAQLKQKLDYDAVSPGLPGARDKREEEVYQALRSVLVVGFCIAGRAGTSRVPHAYEMLFDPDHGAPAPEAIPMGVYRFWGVPNMADRLLHGADGRTRASIVSSPFWSGTAADLDALLVAHHLSHPMLPIRDAIDFVHMCIHSTIKALKFSAYSQVCGGPIEISAITTDRAFRWVKHKKWNAALLEGES